MSALFLRIGTVKHADALQKERQRRYHQISSKREGRNILEFSNFTFSIRARSLLNYVGTAILNKKENKSRTDEDAERTRRKTIVRK